MKRRIDLSFENAYSAPDRVPLRILLAGSRELLSPLDLVGQELEAILNMNDPRFLRM